MPVWSAGVTAQRGNRQAKMFAIMDRHFPGRWLIRIRYNRVILGTCRLARALLLGLLTLIGVQSAQLVNRLPACAMLAKRLTYWLPVIAAFVYMVFIAMFPYHIGQNTPPRGIISVWTSADS